MLLLKQLRVLSIIDQLRAWAPRRSAYTQLSHLYPSLYPCHSRDKLYQALSRFSVLQATESWVGPGNEARPKERISEFCFSFSTERKKEICYTKLIFYILVGQRTMKSAEIPFLESRFISSARTIHDLLAVSMITLLKQKLCYQPKLHQLMCYHVSSD